MLTKCCINQLCNSVTTYFHKRTHITVDYGSSAVIVRDLVSILAIYQTKLQLIKTNKHSMFYQQLCYKWMSTIFSEYNLAQLRFYFTTVDSHIVCLLQQQLKLPSLGGDSP